MRGTFVFMLTIGKTLGGNLMFMIMKKTSARIGKQKTLFQHMQMVARMSIDVNILTDGRNKNIILLTIKCTHADNKKFVQSLIVLTSIQS